MYSSTLTVIDGLVHVYIGDELKIYDQNTLTLIKTIDLANSGFDVMPGRPSGFDEQGHDSDIEGTYLRKVRFEKFDGDEWLGYGKVINELVDVNGNIVRTYPETIDLSYVNESYYMAKSLNNDLWEIIILDSKTDEVIFSVSGITSGGGKDNIIVERADTSGNSNQTVLDYYIVKTEEPTTAYPVVSKDKVWKVFFNKAMSSVTATSDAVYVENSAGEKVEGLQISFSNNGKIMYIHPPEKSGYEQGEYKLVIGKAASSNGKLLKKVNRKQFIVK